MDISSNTPTSTHTHTVPKSTNKLTMQEEKKELLYWESQYTVLFKKLEHRKMRRQQIRNRILQQQQAYANFLKFKW